MTPVLLCEMGKLNQLLGRIRGSLGDLLKAVGGLVVMTAELKATLREVTKGQLPTAWLRLSYPSLKPLASFMDDLAQRVQFFRAWADGGAPASCWIGAFFFPQALLTAVVRRQANKHKVAVDELVWDFSVPREQSPKQGPADGLYVHGLFMEACQWDWNSWELADPEPKMLFAEAPLMYLVPALKASDFPHYMCPCYKTTQRRGVLSTTGHSTSFVMMIKINTSRDSTYWVRRGAAMIAATDE